MSMINNSYYAILAILSIGPMSGYQLKAWVDEGIGYFCNIDYKQIYPTLTKLVDTGLATYLDSKAGNRPTSKIYSLTKAGQRELEGWLIKPVSEGKQSKNELMLKLFFGHLIPLEASFEHINRYKASCIASIKIIEEINECLTSEANKDAFWHYRITTLNRGRLIQQAELEWCEQTIEYLLQNIE